MGGGGRWDDKKWETYVSTSSTRTVHENFTAKKMVDYLDPKNIKVRESRDSDINPQSTAVAIALDVTGSMGMCAQQIATKGLGATFERILSNKPVSDPHVMIMGIGDIRYDRAPLQMTQFEAEVDPMTEQLEKLYLEMGGGGNQTESYDLAWYAAAALTSIDCFEKRGKKGYLFTVGDEDAPAGLPKDLLKDKCGIDVQHDVSASEALEMAERKYHVYHVVVAEGSHCRMSGVDHVKASWVPLLGQRVLVLRNLADLAEVITGAIEMNEGSSIDDVVADRAAKCSDSTAMVVREALEGLVPMNSSTSGLTAV